MQELEALKNELEDSTNTTAANELMRNKREQEVFELKRAIDEEVRLHETTVQELRRKYTQQLEEAAEQLDQVKKVYIIHESVFYLSDGLIKSYVVLQCKRL